MKNIKLLLLALGCVFTSQISAQNDFKIGVNAGLNYPSNRGYVYAKNNNFKIGHLFGVTLEYYLKENLSIKANVNYERKVRKKQLTYFNNQAEETGKENFEDLYEYINIPIVLKHEFGNSKFFVNGGVFVNYLFNQKLDTDYPNDNRISKTEQKKIDFGLSVGIGTIIALNEKNELTIELRDDLGVIDTGGVPEIYEGSINTNAVKLILGWNLGI
ncbi:PorT family protein [Winogradskyella sp. F6397]|uniref:PorT family protein n=1 Tax=Winogradskyella marina TaxID=2785530 RepID=A0ABS0EEA4_9FLAO|nr:MULTISPECIES: porin family protein [Winogradskyella]MBF8148776.1 PorT family protein [Winogradskyella marina]